ncbi:membrin-11-like isoform X2 [Papaver somniferum]|uniref:membrin-11-like isoform X2 n=1 Tax=Papaver somniferum TaxID=3469 RepID=UPI000E6F7DDB|nr:membrin-11-like isoform X2 [Papaver somniferum]
MAMEVGTLSEIHQNSKRLLMRVRGELERLEQLEFSSPSGIDSPELSFSIKRDISQIRSLCFEMDHLWRSIASKTERDLWKRKVEQIAEEADSSKDSLDKHFLRNQKRMTEAKNGDSAHVMRIFDDDSRAIQSARNSSLMLEDAYSTGVAILSKYAEQRDRLKRAQRKALDILNTVGLSNSVLKLVERRHRVDKWIAYTGMIVTVIIVYLFSQWVH